MGALAEDAGTATARTSVVIDLEAVNQKLHLLRLALSACGSLADGRDAPVKVTHEEMGGLFGILAMTATSIQVELEPLIDRIAAGQLN